MKKYLPLLSVALVAGALFCPLAIIAWNSSASESTSRASAATPAPNTAAPAETAPAVSALEEPLARLVRRVEALEASVAQLQSRTALPTTPFVSRDAEEPFIPQLSAPPAPVAPAPTSSPPPIRTAETPAETATTPAQPALESIGETVVGERKSADLAPAVEAASVFQTMLSSMTKAAEQDSSVRSGPQADGVQPPAPSEATARSFAPADPEATTSKAKKARARPTSAKDSAEPEDVADAMSFLEATAQQAALPERQAAAFQLAFVRPMPGTVVRQTEDVLFTTPEAGWPVVLVRSEIDGDHWWVQQLVTRRGSGIAARVNFGNAETIPGQVFELLVLMLDTEGEAIRFRTARKFNELPTGIRRSPIFRFTRR